MQVNEEFEAKRKKIKEWLGKAQAEYDELKNASQCHHHALIIGGRVEAFERVYALFNTNTKPSGFSLSMAQETCKSADTTSC